MSHLNFSILAFSTNFYPLKFKCLVTLFDRKHHASKTCQNGSFLAFFHGILSTQNVNVARFARKVECDFICDFQTPCYLKNCNFRKNELASRTTVFCGDCIRDDSQSCSVFLFRRKIAVQETILHIFHLTCSGGGFHLLTNPTNEPDISMNTAH